ncbi:unnamed protein product [Peniophora sp. CBMAI 1063]|nr:unnamed protein product [Peniophora sp. CBMAI 1063]
MSGPDVVKKYRTKCTGAALETVERHSGEAPYTLFAAVFCPFVQRVWVALEFYGIPYKYYEVDPYKKPKNLLEVSPKGLVPGLKMEINGQARALNESTVILDFIMDLAAKEGATKSLLPPISDPYARALVRLQCDHVSRSLVPAFYRFLQAQDADAQIAGGQEFASALSTLTDLLERGERETGGATGGLWTGDELNLLDVTVAPWIHRTTIVLTHYRAWRMPEGEKFGRWVERLLEHPAFKATTSTEDVYLDSYERYAKNVPGTSQVANAINSGRQLP